MLENREGQNVPQVTFRTRKDHEWVDVSTDDVFKGKTVIVFSLPGAFTPTCSAYHLPGFVEQADELSNKGIDAIACVAVNDVFVMHAWGKSTKADGIDMLADGDGAFANARGLGVDGYAFGMGSRSPRFALVAEDDPVTKVLVTDTGAFRVGSR